VSHSLLFLCQGRGLLKSRQSGFVRHNSFLFNTAMLHLHGSYRGTSAVRSHAPSYDPRTTVGLQEKCRVVRECASLFASHPCRRCPKKNADSCQNSRSDTLPQRVSMSRTQRVTLAKVRPRLRIRTARRVVLSHITSPTGVPRSKSPPPRTLEQG
jgi:hypothetical protein